MKNHRKVLLASALATVLALGGCWDDDDDDPAPTSTEVPESAGVGTAAFVSYLLSLSANDEASEPLTLTGTFAVPPDETAEPTALN